MSGPALTWAIAQRGSGPGMQVLLLTLGLSATDPNQLVELPIDLLAEYTRQSRRSVTRLLAELEEMEQEEIDKQLLDVGPSMSKYPVIPGQPVSAKSVTGMS